MLMLKQVDSQLREWQAVSQKYKRPREGWVKTVRKALGMTAQQLALRMGLMRSRIVQLEEAEKHDAITLKTLKRAAEAMDCELVYAIVPKISPHGKTLEDIVKNKATMIAKMIVGNVAHSMSLEDQSIEKNQQKRQEEELLKELLENSFKKIIWKSREENQPKEQKKTTQKRKPSQKNR